MITLDWKSCATLSSHAEYEAMERLVKVHAESLDRDLLILEIGSYQGQSTSLLAQFGTVYAIDLWGDVDDGAAHPERIGQVNLAPFLANMNRFGLIESERVFPVVGTSGALALLPDLAFDVIYIDASHYYEPVKLDIWRSERHLKPGGLFVFHDYKRPGDNPQLGVNIAVDELLAQGNYSTVEHFGGLLCLKADN